MERIGTVGKIKITKEGMIADVKLDNNFRNRVFMEVYKLEDRIIDLEFKYARLEEMKKELEAKNSTFLVKSFIIIQKKIKKEIKSLQKTIKLYCKIYK
jgi:phage host-nuclease inhibitor protein Gam